MGTVKIGDAFSAGWGMYKENLGLCILASIIAWIVGGVSCGICAGPMSCGLFMILRRLAQKSDPKPDVGDVFKGFDFFLHSFLLLLICGICYFIVQTILFLIPVVGWLLAFVLAWIYGPALTWALMLVANRGMKWNKAIGLVIKETISGKFLMPILLGILAGLVGAVGIFACGFGLIFTMPFALCVYAAAYEQVFGAEPEVVA